MFYSIRNVTLVKFIPKYFIIFDAIANGIGPSISFSGGLVQMNGNTINFDILLLHPANLLTPFISSNSFFSEFLRISTIALSAGIQFYFFLSDADAFYFTFLPNRPG